MGAVSVVNILIPSLRPQLGLWRLDGESLLLLDVALEPPTVPDLDDQSSVVGDVVVRGYSTTSLHPLLLLLRNQNVVWPAVDQAALAQPRVLHPHSSSPLPHATMAAHLEVTRHAPQAVLPHCLHQNLLPLAHSRA